MLPGEQRLGRRAAPLPGCPVLGRGQLREVKTHEQQGHPLPCSTFGGNKDDVFLGSCPAASLLAGSVDPVAMLCQRAAPKGGLTPKNPGDAQELRGSRDGAGHLEQPGAASILLQLPRKLPKRRLGKAAEKSRCQFRRPNYSPVLQGRLQTKQRRWKINAPRP